MILVVGVGNLLGQGLIGVLPALVFDLLGAQFGAVLFAGGELMLQVGEGGGELLGIEVAVVPGLMIEQSLITLQQQHLGLFDGFFVVLQALAQFADLRVVDPQQIFEATVIQLGMSAAPVGDFVGEIAIFVFQRLQTLLLRLEFGGDLHPLRTYVLQLLRRCCLGTACLLYGVFQPLLPLLGAAVLAQQLCKSELASRLLFGQCSELLLGDLLLLHAGLLAILFFLKRLLTLLLLGKFFLLLIELCEAFGDLPIQLHERRSRLHPQRFEGFGRQQTAERGELLVEPLTVAAQFALLVAQVLGRLLMRGFGVAQLLGQARGVLLQGEQGALTLFVLSDALVQLIVLPAQPGVALFGVLVQKLCGQWVSVEARCQGLLLGVQLLLLLQQLLLPGDDAHHLGAQFGELFLELVDRLLRPGLFVFIVATETLQQRFGLMVRMLVTAADRARLVVLQLRAQLFDTRTAGQTLALQQFPGDVEGLFGDRQFGFGFHPVLSQALTFLLRGELTLLQFGAALVQFLLAGPQPRQVFDGAQLFTVVLQQVAEDADLLGHGVRLRTGLLEQHFKLLLLQGEFFAVAGGVLFEGRQLGLAFVQAIADQHQLLQAIPIGIPRVAERRQMGALFKLGGDTLQTFGNLLLLFQQGLNGALALGAGLFCVVLRLGAEGGVPGQAGEGALLFEGLTQ
ncbi:hypothetical protein D3C73_656290 [compost metagenome]